MKSQVVKGFPFLEHVITVQSNEIAHSGTLSLSLLPVYSLGRHVLGLPQDPLAWVLAVQQLAGL